MGGSRPLTAAQQLLSLQLSRICAGKGVLRLGRLVWEFETQPTPLSRVYRLRVLYQQDGVPKVLVVDPDLAELAEGRKLPHVYEQRPAQLCLYLPRAREWDRSMQISETILPWSILWLFYFEEWLASDEWKGGGMHPERSQERRRASGRNPSAAK